jgi:PTH1 family peptidyl-tRNA hydrolase
MAEKDCAVIGLGNPGKRYEGTRHNVGFMFLDQLAASYNQTFSKSKWDALALRMVLWNRRVLLVKPETYMNRSGRAVAASTRYFNIPVERIIVVHDDIDMHLGRIKLVDTGGSGGHNGIRSIIQSLGSADFYRLKIGIGRPGKSEAHPDMPIDKFVLSDFSSDEYAMMQERFSLIEQGIALLAEGDSARAKNLLNSLK